MALAEQQKAKLRQAFRPHSPIQDPAAFQGRIEERQRVHDAVMTPGLHVVIYGERGAGKTSLANVATADQKRIQVFCERSFSFGDLARAILLPLAKDDPEKVVFDAQTGMVSKGGIRLQISALTGNDLRSFLPTSYPLCIVLDELDRIESPGVAADVAELCKNLSTYQTNISLVMVGVADTADALLRGHASNIRNLRQVPLGRMQVEDMNAILQHGEGVLGISFDHQVKKRVVTVSDRFPYYLHLIAMNSATKTLERNSFIVQMEDYESGVVSAAKDCDEVLSSAYETAILSTQGSEIYRRIVWALAELDETQVTPSTLADRVNRIAQKESDQPVSVQAVGQALKKLTRKEKKEILSTRAEGFYSFTNPLMRGYVRLVRERR